MRTAFARVEHARRGAGALSCVCGGWLLAEHWSPHGGRTMHGSRNYIIFTFIYKQIYKESILDVCIIAGRAAARIINNHTYTFRFKKIIWRGTVVGVGEAARAEVVWIHFAARPPPREFRGATECLCMCVQSSGFTILSFVLYREHGACDDTPLACWRGHPRAQSHGGRRTPLTTARL